MTIGTILLEYDGIATRGQYKEIRYHDDGECEREASARSIDFNALAGSFD